MTSSNMKKAVEITQQLFCILCTETAQDIYTTVPKSEHQI